MELYFSPFACSLASHITAREAGLDIEMTAVTLATKQTAGGDDYYGIAPKGQVPALRLDDGTLLTENPVVMQYLADRAPGSTLLPAPATTERYAVLEWMNFVGTEMHKLCFYPMFSPDAPDAAKGWARGLLEATLDYVNARLEGREFLACDAFTIADAYMTWALTLCEKIGTDLESRPAARDYLKRMQSRPAVRAAMSAELSVMRAAS